MSGTDFGALDAVGLNLQAVFDLDDLPDHLRDRLLNTTDSPPRLRQLILIGNAGPTLWRSVCASDIDSNDPIDAFSVREANRWLDQHCPGHTQHRLYPGHAPVDLQQLGQLAGWHHASPFKLGIQPGWGTWFAYRVALLADTALPGTAPRHTTSPCLGCIDSPCVRSCPAGAMADGNFALDACIDYRQRPDSRCADTCVARLHCPVGEANRYDTAQIRHVYSNSLRMIARYRATAEQRSPEA
ncbi:MAG TPA: hypothetical protein PLI17_13075 [Denitromonas sp.]|nr:hypothetical protein [Denitromonas sp.]